jgi:hypothetical protein
MCLLLSASATGAVGATVARYSAYMVHLQDWPLATRLVHQICWFWATSSGCLLHVQQLRLASFRFQLPELTVQLFRATRTPLLRQARYYFESVTGQLIMCRRHPRIASVCLAVSSTVDCSVEHNSRQQRSSHVTPMTFFTCCSTCTVCSPTALEAPPHPAVLQGLHCNLHI